MDLLDFVGIAASVLIGYIYLIFFCKIRSYFTKFYRQLSLSYDTSLTHELSYIVI